MKHAQHDQEACADVLRNEFRVENASQWNVSRWMRGEIKFPGCVDALLAYTHTYMPPSSSSRPTPASPEDEHEDFDSERVDSTASREAFQALSKLAANQRLLGPEQLELIRAMNHRLAHGPSLSRHDLAAYELQTSLLGLSDR